MIGIAGPSLLNSQLLGAVVLPEVALVRDVDGDWTYVTGGETVPEGYMIVDSGGDFAIDDTVSSGLELVIDGDGDLAVVQ
jgi:hypothetical protein